MSNILILADLNSPLMKARIMMLQGLPYKKYILHNANNLKLSRDILTTYADFIVLEHPYIASARLRYAYSFFYTLYLLLTLRPRLIVVHWASRLYQNILLALWGKYVIVHTMGGDIDKNQDCHGKKRFFVKMLLQSCKFVSVKSPYMTTMIKENNLLPDDSKIIQLSWGVEDRFFATNHNENQESLQDRLFHRRFDRLFFSIRALTPFYRQKEIIQGFLSHFKNQEKVGLIVSLSRKDDAYYSSIADKEQPNIIFLDIPHDRIHEYILASDCVISYSKSDGLSQSILEALAGGKWILANELPHHLDLLEHGKNAYLFSDDDGLKDGFLEIFHATTPAMTLELQLLQESWQKEYYLSVLKTHFGLKI